MINYQKFNFFAILTINSVTIGVRELNETSQISLVTHDAKGEMREIMMRYRQVSREWWFSSILCPFYFVTALLTTLPYNSFQSHCANTNLFRHADDLKIA